MSSTDPFGPPSADQLAAKAARDHVAPAMLGSEPDVIPEPVIEQASDVDVMGPSDVG